MPNSKGAMNSSDLFAVIEFPAGQELMILSGAISRFTLGIDKARTTGSSWYSSISMPLRNGECNARSSLCEMAPHRTASKNA